MKKLLYTATIVFFSAQLQAQSIKDVFKNVSKKDSNGKTEISKKLPKVSGATILSNEEIIAGLREALSVGSGNAANKLSAVDGFFKDAAIKILMPDEAKKVERTLRDVGMGKQVDNAILTMNRAAEDAAKEAAPIFINAVKSISFTDALSILKGSDNAATQYLTQKTSEQLTAAFKPIIESSLKKVDATKHWNAVFTNYNRFSKDKINPDLTAYVTEKALQGIFYQLAAEEKKIRKDPMARTTDILKKVFAQ